MVSCRDSDGTADDSDRNWAENKDFLDVQPLGDTVGTADKRRIDHNNLDRT